MQGGVKVRNLFFREKDAHALCQGMFIYVGRNSPPEIHDSDRQAPYSTRGRWGARGRALMPSMGETGMTIADDAVVAAVAEKMTYNQIVANETQR